jgi:hypothetical protein
VKGSSRSSIRNSQSLRLTPGVEFDKYRDHFRSCICRLPALHDYERPGPDLCRTRGRRRTVVRHPAGATRALGLQLEPRCVVLVQMSRRAVTTCCRPAGLSLSRRLGERWESHGECRQEHSGVP